MAKTVNPAWEQDSAQGFNDGTESGSTTKAAVNTGWTQDVDEIFLYRILIQETAGCTTGPTLAVRLQARRNGGTWFQVTTSSTIVQIVNSSNLTHGDDTTQRIGSDLYVSDNNWVADTSGDTNATTDIFGVPPDGGVTSECEALWAVQIVGDDVNDADTIEFQAVQTDNSAFDSYVPASIFTIEANKTTVVPLTVAPADAVGAISDQVAFDAAANFEPADAVGAISDAAAFEADASFEPADAVGAISDQVAFDLSASDDWLHWENDAQLTTLLRM